MKIFNFVSCSEVETDIMVACKIILKSQGLSFTHLVDVKGAMTLSRGRLNPVCGFVLVAPDETILLDCFDVCNWIESKGLKRL